MARKNAALLYAQTAAREIVAEQTRVRLMLGFDAAIIAANEVFHMGPGRAAAFANAYNSAMEELAAMYVDAGDGDRDMSYAKGKRDEVIKRIVGEENFVPFDQAYTAAYMDELRRVRVLTEMTNVEGEKT